MAWVSEILNECHSEEMLKINSLQLSEAQIRCWPLFIQYALIERVIWKGKCRVTLIWGMVCWKGPSVCPLSGGKGWKWMLQQRYKSYWCGWNYRSTWEQLHRNSSFSFLRGGRHWSDSIPKPLWSRKTWIYAITEIRWNDTQMDCTGDGSKPFRRDTQGRGGGGVTL